MSLMLNVDRIVDIRPTRIEQGRRVQLSGWAIDATTRRTPRVYAQIDGKLFQQSGSTSLRDDVAACFYDDALRFGGFYLSIPLPTLGEHEVAVGAYENDVFVVGARFQMSCVQQKFEPWPRVIVASSPKSGSTYTWSVLKGYFRTADPPLRDSYQVWEQNVDGWILDRLRDRAFVTGLHLKAYDHTLAMLKAEAIVPVVTWRNLADTIISADDDIRRQQYNGVYHDMYIEPVKYFALSEQQRYQHLIRYMLPWNVSFYLGWRTKAPSIFVHYEDLAVNPESYFSGIIKALEGSVDIAKLREAISSIEVPDKTADWRHRFNVGINGRAIERMTVETKSMLEEALSHQFEDVSDLVEELPWNRPRSAAPSEARTVAAT
jgi:hypothetical protein